MPIYERSRGDITNNARLTGATRMPISRVRCDTTSERIAYSADAARLSSTPTRTATPRTKALRKCVRVARAAPRPSPVSIRRASDRPPVGVPDVGGGGRLYVFDRDREPHRQRRAAEARYRSITSPLERDRLARSIFRPCRISLEGFILSLSLSRHSPADDDAAVPGGHDTTGVVGQREALLGDVGRRRRARRRRVDRRSTGCIPRSD